MVIVIICRSCQTTFTPIFLLLKWFKSTFYGVEVNRLVFYLVWVRVIIIHKKGRQHLAIGIRMSSPNSEIYDYNSKSLILRWKKLWEWMNTFIIRTPQTRQNDWCPHGYTFTEARRAMQTQQSASFGGKSAGLVMTGSRFERSRIRCWKNLTFIINAVQIFLYLNL